MNHNLFRVWHNIVGSLRDPVWGGIGVLITLATLIIAYATYQDSGHTGSQNELVILRQYEGQISLPDGAETLGVRIDAGTNDSQRALLFRYKITASPGQNIQPKQFITPISIEVNDPFKILTFNNIPDHERGISKQFDLSFQRINDNRIDIEPFYINTLEHATLGILVLAPDDKYTRDISIARPSFRGRIEGYSIQSISGTELFNKYTEPSNIAKWFGTTIHLDATQSYLFGIVFLGLFLVILKLLTAANILISPTKAAILGLISGGTAEVFVHGLGNSLNLLSNTAPIAFVFPLSYAILSCLLLILSMRRHK